MQKIILFAFIIFLISCNTAQKKPADTKVDQPAIENVAREPHVSLSLGDTLRVYKKCAVFYSQDSAEMAKRRKEIGEEDFYTGADDYAYYQANARHFLDSVKLPTINVQKEKVILFINESTPVYSVQINTLPELMGVYFYNPPKEVLKPDMLDIGEDYESYFND